MNHTAIEEYKELYCDYGVLFHQIRDKLFLVLKELSKDSGSLILQLYRNNGSYKFTKFKHYEIPYNIDIKSAEKRLTDIALNYQEQPELSSRYIFFDSSGLIYAISDEPNDTRIFFKKEHSTIGQKLSEFTQSTNS